MANRSPSSPGDRRKNPARKTDRRSSKSAKRDYRVVPNGWHWDVERDGKVTGSFAYDINTVIRLATAEAQRDVHNGLTATVCVEEKDGTCRHLWP